MNFCVLLQFESTNANLKMKNTKTNLTISVTAAANHKKEINKNAKSEVKCVWLRFGTFIVSLITIIVITIIHIIRAIQKCIYRFRTFPFDRVMNVLGIKPIMERSKSLFDPKKITKHTKSYADYDCTKIMQIMQIYGNVMIAYLCDTCKCVTESTVFYALVTQTFD